MQKSKKIDLSIIVVNYNGGEWLAKTLDTLHEWYLRKTKLSVEVILVDNASQDSSQVEALKKHPEISLIQNDQNFGFAVANNQGISASKGKHVMLLNSDVELDQRSNLDHLVQYLEDHPKVGAITPQLLMSNGELDWASHRGEPTVWAALTYFSGLEKKFPQIKLFSQYHQTTADLTQIHPIDACSGAAMIVKSSVIESVGLLDEQFFMYAEDLDWCKRIREAGYQIIFYPSVILIHHKNKSGIASGHQQTANKTNRFFYQTMVQYYDKHYGKMYPRFVRWVVQFATKLLSR